MTREAEFIDLLEGYLDEFEGATPLPDATRDALRAKLPSIHQRPAWWPRWRFPEMNNVTKLSLAAAAVLVAALLGFNFLVAPNVGSSGLDDPSVAPTPTPPVLSGGALDPGTYRLTTAGIEDASLVFADDATITVPAGWVNADGFGVDKADTKVRFWPWLDDLTHVYRDPCNWRDTEIVPPVGPTVDDLANALADQAQRGDGLPVNVTVGGSSGKMIELTVPDDADFTICDTDGGAGEFRSWSGRYHQGPGQVDQVYILDVGGDRMVLFRSYMPGTSDADLAEGDAIIESIQLGGS